MSHSLSEVREGTGQGKSPSLSLNHLKPGIQHRAHCCVSVNWDEDSQNPAEIWWGLLALALYKKLLHYLCPPVYSMWAKCEQHWNPSEKKPSILSHYISFQIMSEGYQPRH